MPIINQIVKGGGGSAPAHYIEKTVDANGMLMNGSSFIDFTGVVSIAVGGLRYAYYSNTNLTGAISFGNVTTLYQEALASCFVSCTGITSVVFPSVNSLYSSVFNRCFQGCTNLTTLSFPALTSTSFHDQTNQFNYMLMNVTGCTVHFPSNIQSVIGSWASVTGGFSGTNTTVLFDLPATNTLTGADTITYTRNPKYDTATALAWKVGAYETTNFTPAYYTSGTTDPQIGDTIYSDAACTTAVTTISAIA